jgi:RNA-directed DNA polymerase
MTSGDAERRAEKLESHPEGSRRNRREEGLGASKVTARREYSGPETEQLMEAVVERENMKLALARVEQNRGAAGVDKMTVEQLRAYLREHWQRIKEELLADDYHPQPVLKVEIPKGWRQRNENSGHSDGNRPTDSTGAAPSPKSHL